MRFAPRPFWIAFFLPVVLACGGCTVTIARRPNPAQPVPSSTARVVAPLASLPSGEMECEGGQCALPGR